MAYALDGDILQHLHLLRCQRTSGSHHDTLARMDAQRVEILHRSHRETMVVGVADALKLNLLPSFKTLLYQNLWGKGEGTFSQLAESLLVRTDTGTQTAQCVCRTDHDGEAYLVGSLQRVVHVLHSVAYWCLQADLVQLLHKQVAVLCVHDGLYRGTQHLYAILLQHASLIQFRATVQCSLSAKRQQNAVGTLLLDDFGYEVGGYRLEIDLVGNTFRGLNGSNVGVY